MTDQKKRSSRKKNTVVQDIREKTYKDMLNNLNKSGRCAILRPTGFGKTWLLTKLISEPKYQNILYLYPAQVIKDTVVNRYFDSMYETSDGDVDAETIETCRALENIDGVTLMTYAKLARFKGKTILAMHYDLIICDEMHRLGASRTKLAVSKLISANPDDHIVGATATPVRTSDKLVILSAFQDDMDGTYYFKCKDTVGENLYTRDELLQIYSDQIGAPIIYPKQVA